MNNKENNLYWSLPSLSPNILRDSEKTDKNTSYQQLTSPDLPTKTPNVKHNSLRHTLFGLGSKSKLSPSISAEIFKSLRNNPHLDNNRQDEDFDDDTQSEDDISSFFKYYRQVFSVMVTSSLMLLSGLVIGWSTVLPKLQDDHDLNLNLTSNDVKWIISCAWLAEIPANLIAGSLMEWLGPRKVMFMLQVPAALSWILIAFAPSIPMLYLCRVCLGIVQGVADTLVQPLVAELSEPGIRGILSVLPSINTACGVLIIYLLGNFCHWKVATALCAFPAILTFMFAPLVPESSYWLMRHDKRDQARSSLEQLIGSSRSNTVKEIFSEIETSVRDQPVATLKEQMYLLKSPQYWKPLFLLIALFIARETGGQSIVFTYTVYLFTASGITLDPFTCTILVGVVRLVFTIIGALFMDFGGRRRLLISTMFICSVALLTAGVAIITDGSQWIPLGAVLLFAAAYSTGVNPVPWVLQGELLPTPIRSLGSSISTICYSLSVFAITNTFPELLNKIGLGYSFILFSSCMTLTTIMSALFIPETKGRSLLELEKVFVKYLKNDDLEAPNIIQPTEKGQII